MNFNFDKPIETFAETDPDLIEKVAIINRLRAALTQKWENEMEEPDSDFKDIPTNVFVKGIQEILNLKDEEIREYRIYHYLVGSSLQRAHEHFDIEGDLIYNAFLEFAKKQSIEV